MSDKKHEQPGAHLPFVMNGLDRSLRPPTLGPALRRDDLAEIADRYGAELLASPSTATFPDGERWWIVALWRDGDALFQLRTDGVVVKLENARVTKVESDPPDGVEVTDLGVRPIDVRFGSAGRQDGGDQ